MKFFSSSIFMTAKKEHSWAHRNIYRRLQFWNRFELETACFLSFLKYLQETTVLKSISVWNFEQTAFRSSLKYLHVWYYSFESGLNLKQPAPPPPKSVSKLQPKNTILFIACRGRVGCGGWRHLIFNRLIQFFFQSFFQTSFSSPGIRFNSLLNKKCWDGCLARWQAGSNIF